MSGSIGATPPGYTDGTATAEFSIMHNGAFLHFDKNELVRAHPNLKAALVAAGAPITWNVQPVGRKVRRGAL